MRELTFVHRGSTKDVYQWNHNYVFRFSDRYSVFDWGEMPDHIEGKGRALAQFTKLVYKHLESKGIQTHLLDEKSESDEIVVKPFEVVRTPGPLAKRGGVFIPLEVIFRMGVAKGSSLLKRSDKYFEGQKFDVPMIEFTTKLERFDRPLTHQEAQELAGMDQTEWKDLINTTTKIALELETLFVQAGISLWDGKVEFAFGPDRQIVLVDSIGPDELRITCGDVQLSKEIIRQYYRRSDWYKKLDEVKTKHGEAFKDFIAAPENLNQNFRDAITRMYSLMPALIENPLKAKPDLDQLLIELQKATA